MEVSEKMKDHRLFIGGLFPEVTNTELNQRFSCFGNIKGIEVKIRKDCDGGPLKTFAYIDIELKDSNLKKLMSSYNKTKWKGSELKIQEAKENFLLRLEKERNEQKESLKSEKMIDKVSQMMESSTNAQKKILDNADDKDMTASMKPSNAKPGTLVPGHKNWIVGKYGRVLPIVQMKKNPISKVMKIDPSKFTHTVKKIKENEEIPISPDKLTWQLAENNNELTRKRKGEFPAMKSDKKRCSDFQEIQRKLDEIIRSNRMAGDDLEMEVVPVEPSVVRKKPAANVKAVNKRNEPLKRKIHLLKSDSDSDSDSVVNESRNLAMDLSRFDSDVEEDLSSQSDIFIPEKAGTGISKNKTGVTMKGQVTMANQNMQSKNKIFSEIKNLPSTNVGVKTNNSEKAVLPDSNTTESMVEIVPKSGSKTLSNTASLPLSTVPKLIEGKKKLREFGGTRLLSKPVFVENNVQKHNLGSKFSSENFVENEDARTENKISGKVYNSSDEDDTEVSDHSVGMKSWDRSIMKHSVSKSFAMQYSLISEYASGITETDNPKSSAFDSDSSVCDVHDDDDSDFESFVKREALKAKSLGDSVKSGILKVDYTQIRSFPGKCQVVTNSERAKTVSEETVTAQPLVKNSLNTKTSIQNNSDIKTSMTEGNYCSSDSDSDASEQDSDSDSEGGSESDLKNLDSDDEEKETACPREKDSLETCGDSSATEDKQPCDSIDHTKSGSSAKLTAADGDDDDGNDNDGDIDDIDSYDDNDDDDESDDGDSSDSESHENMVNNEVNLKNIENVSYNGNSENNVDVDTTCNIDENATDKCSESDSDDESGGEVGSDSDFEALISEAVKTVKTSNSIVPVKITSESDKNKLSGSGVHLSETDVKQCNNDNDSDSKSGFTAKSLIGKTRERVTESGSSTDSESDKNSRSKLEIVKRTEVKSDESSESGESETTESDKDDRSKLENVKQTEVKSDESSESDESETTESSNSEYHADDCDIARKQKVMKNNNVKDRTTKIGNVDGIKDGTDNDNDSDSSDDDHFDTAAVKSDFVKDGHEDTRKLVHSDAVVKPGVHQSNNIIGNDKNLDRNVKRIQGKQQRNPGDKSQTHGQQGSSLVCKQDKMYGKTRKVEQLFEQSDNKVDTDMKRLEAVRKKVKENMAQKSLIQSALSNLDSNKAANKKIIFESDSDEDDVVTMDTSQITPDLESSKKLAELGFETGVKTKSLFESSDDDDDEDDGARFELRQEFEGEGGKMLATLQSRYGNDERFKLDSRFIESDSELEAAEVEVEDETQRALKILQSVVGVKAMKGVSKMEKAKKQFKDIGTLKYDPTKEEHQEQFEIKKTPKKQPEENKTKKKRKKKDKPLEEVPEVVLPEVSKDKFYEVSDSLKNIFIEKAKSDSHSDKQTGSGFSLLSTFGKTQSDDVSQNEAQSGSGFSLLAMFGKNQSDSEAEDNTDDAAVPIPATLRSNQLSLDNRFKVMDDGNDDSGVDDQPSTDDDGKRSEKKPAQETSDGVSTSVVRKPSTFFFLPNDRRLKENLKKSEPEMDRKAWYEKRRHLIDSYKSKHKNYKRKHKDDKKRGSGSQRGGGRGGRGGFGRHRST